MNELDITHRLIYEECDGECIQPCHIHEKVREDASIEITRLRCRIRELCAAFQPYHPTPYLQSMIDDALKLASGTDQPGAAP
jgi:hypothetical protein